VAGIYGGLAVSVTLVVFSPVTSGKVDPLTGHSLSLLPAGVDFAWFPLENPALVSIPAGLLCAVAGTLLSREKADPARFAELSARALTGVGAHR
jgi:cation/acetate symporter